MLGRVEKNATSIFQGLFRNIVFRSVVTKELWAILDFIFHRPDFFTPCTQPYTLKKISFTKNPLNFYSLKVTFFHDDGVKNESARTKKLQGGENRMPPPPACLEFRGEG